MEKSWHKWEPDGPDQGSVLREIARHMESGWQVRDQPGNTRFKAAHQLAHKGWKYGSGVIDLADGEGVPGIKALRALIIAGRYDWFKQAAALAPGDQVTALSAPSPAERSYLVNLCGPTTPLSRIVLDDAEIWMLAEPAGWRVAAVFIDDASKSGMKDILQLATATRGGCLTIAAALAVSILLAGWVLR